MTHRVQGFTFAISEALLLAGTLCLGCSGPAGTTEGKATAPKSPAAEESSAAAVDPFAPGASVLCDVGTSAAGTPELEFYQLSAMNHKLAQYPEFAAAIGRESVSECESARAFARGYREYSAAHPGFDDDEPLAPMEEIDAPLGEHPPASLESPKVFNGTQAKNNAVVQLVMLMPRNADPSWGVLSVSDPDKPDLIPKASCTGTFIAKNWILTAAHCITFTAITTCMESGRPKDECKPRLVHTQPEPEWDNEAPYEIFGTSGAAQTPYVLHGAWGRAYTHPNWLGRDLTTNPEVCDADHPGCHDHLIGDQHDLGLIYIGEDGRLPANIEEDGAKRLSVIPPQANPAPRFWGYGGDPKEVFDEFGGKLRVNDPSRPLAYSVQTNYVEGRLPSSQPTGGSSYPCAGDSGGPLFRTGDQIKTNSGSLAIVEAIIGVNASGPLGCERQFSGVWRWTRVDVPTNRDWIKKKLALQPFANGTERCTPRAFATGNPPMEQGFPVMDECWGQPCSGDTCPGGYSCSRPGRTLAASGEQCEACGNDSCDCIVGQCVRLAPEVKP